MRRSDSDPHEPTEPPADTVPDRDHTRLDATTDEDIERQAAREGAPILSDDEMGQQTVHYVALMGQDGTRTTIEFPDCPGCATFAEAEQNPEAIASEALEAWLESQFEAGAPIPRPTENISPSGGTIAALIPISPTLVARLRARIADRKAHSA